MLLCLNQIWWGGEMNKNSKSNIGELELRKHLVKLFNDD